MEIFENSQSKNEVASIDLEPITIQELAISLTNDGFTVNHMLDNDIKRFGLNPGIVLVRDGSDGMRINTGDNDTLKIGIYNSLRNENHPLYSIAEKKYKDREILKVNFSSSKKSTL